MAVAGVTRIGTAGWSIPAALRAQFPDQGSLLEKYGSVLNAAEINTSFYRPHQRKTYERWAASVPRGFRFAVKLPRSISHDARLENYDAPLTRFLSEAEGLGEKLGVILVQLPPKLAYDKRVSARFFADLGKRAACAIACEPRHASWFTPVADAALARLGVARVAADPPRDPADGVPGGAGALAYYRFHGAPKIYWSAYGDKQLAAMAATMKRAKNVWCMFDNTASGAALDDALRLKKKL